VWIWRKTPTQHVKEGQKVIYVVGIAS
jgi:hypothetical protein